MWFCEVNSPVIPTCCALVLNGAALSSDPTSPIPLSLSPFAVWLPFAHRFSLGKAARDAHSRSCSLPHCLRSRRKRQSTTGLTALPFPNSTCPCSLQEGLQSLTSPSYQREPSQQRWAACGLCSHMPPDQPNNTSACNTAQFCLCNHNLFPFFSVSSTHPGKGRERKQELTLCSSLTR